MTVSSRRSVATAGIRTLAVLVVVSGALFAIADAGWVTAQNVTDDKMEAGKKIFEQIIASHGGRKLLSNIKDTTFKADYRILPQGTDMTAIYYTKFPDKFRVDMNMGGTTTIRAFDGRSGWMKILGTGTIREMSAQEMSEFVNSALSAQGMLNPEMLKISPAMEGRMPIDGKDFLVISYNNWGGFDTVYALIDPETYLPYRYTNIKAGGKTEVINADYREIEGLTLPFSFTLNMDSKMLIKMSVKEWKFNNGIEDSFFEKKAVVEGKAWGVADMDQLGDDVRKPEVIHRVEPVYPVLAKRARVSGTVKLRITINVEGKVEAVRIVDGHPLLNEAAVSAIKQWRYTPAIQNGKPVPVTINVPLIFKVY